MKVVQVVPSLASRSGGPAVAALDTARALAYAGIRCVTVTTDLGSAPSAKRRSRLGPDGLSAIGRGTATAVVPVRFPARVAFAPRIWSVLREECRDADIVHIYSLFLFPQFAAWRAARRSGIPHIVAPCGALDPFLRSRSVRLKAANDALWQRRMLDTAGLIHYTTEDERDLASDLRIAAPAAVLPHPIDFDAFSNATGTSFRRRYMRNPTAPLVVNVGRISHKKGLDRLVAAFSTVLDVIPDAELAIVGPDDEGLERTLRAQATSLGIADSVRFTGLLVGSDLYDATAAADVWALPSHTENLGLAVLEALAAGRAVVITPQVNLAPLLHTAGGAIVAPAENPATFGGEIAKVLKDSALRAELGRSGRDFAKRFSHQALAPRFRDMYERVIQEHRV